MIFKKIYTLFFRADLFWMYRYYGKKSRYMIGYWWYTRRGIHHLPVTIDGTTITLSFFTPYHYEIVRSFRKDPTGDPILLSWKNTPADRYYDIGAFSGIYGLLAAKVHPASDVKIFEPDPVNARHIRENISANQLRNCALVEAAVTDHDGAIRFAATGKTDARISESGVEVKAVSLSSLPHADLIKLDVEGAEFDVLCGMDYHSTIMLELHPSKLKVGETRFWELVKEKGYRHWFIDYQRGTGGQQCHYLLY